MDAMKFPIKRMILAVSTWIVVSLILSWALGGNRWNLGFSLFFGVVVLPLFMVLWWRLLKPPKAP